MDLRDFPFLADENIGPAVVEYLREEGFEVESILEGEVFGKSDRELLSSAFANGQVILTQDSDFGTLVFKDEVEFTGIFYLRPGHLSGEFHISTLKTVFSGNLSIQPPFIIVAENTGSTVRIRLRNFS